MRKSLLTLLLVASVSVPAMAQDQGGRHHDRDDRSDDTQGDDAVTARAERSVRVERERNPVADRANWSDRAVERRRAIEPSQTQQPVAEQSDDRRSRQPGAEQRDERRSWQQPRSQDDGVFAGARRPLREQGAPRDDDARQFRRDRPARERNEVREEHTRTRDGDVTVRRGNGDYSGAFSHPHTQWDQQWRADNHYDWRRHRDRYRSVYRLGHYRDPYGSRYRHFSIGFSLFPSYYQSSYWLYDPFMYRLPPVYGPYRWVRYYDDALLVNIYTGRVVDVVHDFFW